MGTVVGMDPLSGSRGSRDRGDSPQTPAVNALALSSSIPHLDDGCGTGHQRLHELQDLIEQYKIEESKRRMANNQIIQDLQAGALWEEIGNQMAILNQNLGGLGEDVETEVNSLRGQLDKIADAASEARDLLEQDLIHEEEIRDRQAKSELGQRAEKLHQMVTDMRAEIAQMEVASTTQIEFSTDNLLNTVDKQMGQAMTDAQDNRSHLEEQFSQTQNMLAAFGNKISDVGQRTNLSRKLLDDMCGEGNEGVKELRRKLRDLELTSLRGNPQWIQEACEEDEQVSVLRESVTRLRYQIDLELEGFMSDMAGVNKPDITSDQHSHWTASGQPLVDAAAVMIFESDLKSQNFTLEKIEGQISGSWQQPDGRGGKLAPSKFEVLQNQYKMLKQKLETAKRDLAAGEAVVSTDGTDPTLALQDQLGVAAKEREQLHDQAQKSAADRSDIRGGVEALKQRLKVAQLHASLSSLKRKFEEAPDGRLRELDELWLEAAELLVEHNGSMLVGTTAERRFEKVDTGNSGKITKPEFVAAYGENRAGEFHKADYRGDGQLSKQEYVAGEVAIKLVMFSENLIPNNGLDWETFRSVIEQYVAFQSRTPRNEVS